VAAVSGAYQVVVTRERGAWLAEVPGAPGVQTWARSLSRLDVHIREAIAVNEDLPDGAEATLRIDYEYRTGDPELDASAAEARALRERVERERHALARRTEQLAQALVRRQNVSVRDAAVITGVSMQRISQLAGSGRVTAAVAADGPAVVGG
jgi:hypothetical protein